VVRRPSVLAHWRAPLVHMIECAPAARTLITSLPHQRASVLEAMSLISSLP
jgi:hypothetical protein